LEGQGDPRPVVAADLAGLGHVGAVERKALERFVAGLERRVFAPGEMLVVQGAPAPCAYLVEDGQVAVVVRQPGGGGTPVGTIGAGELVGEVGLVHDGPRTASVVAAGRTCAIRIGLRRFEAALLERNAAAIELVRHIQDTLARRFAETRDRLLAVPVEESCGSAPSAAAPAREPCAFDHRAFAGLLPFFRHFSAEDRDSLLDAAEVFDIAPGGALFAQGEASDLGYVVLRGAVALTGGPAARQLGIMGPGRSVGVTAALRAEPYPVSARARSRATLAALPATSIRAMVAAGDARGVALLRAICGDLAIALGRINNDLTSALLRAGIRAGAPDAGASV
jgi:CRP-like cAMP-binding protein